MPKYRVQPTTIHQMEKPRHHAAENGDTAEPELCGEELARGGTCTRPADECPYHAERTI